MTEKRFIRKGYIIWDTWKDKEVYELHYRYEVDDICCILNKMIEENEELKSLIKALKKSNADFINQIKKAYDEDLSVKELADNCGIDLE